MLNAAPLSFLELRAAGPLNFNLTDSGFAEHMLTGPVLVSGVWQHFAATWDGATMRLYVDAVEVASGARGEAKARRAALRGGGGRC